MDNGNDLRVAERVAPVVGVIGLAVCVAAGFASRTAAMQSYLIAYLFWIALSLGSLSLLLLQHTVRGRWGIAIRRLLEAAASTLPLMALLFLPILLFKSQLYPWAGPEAAADELIAKKAAYLNGTAFIVRAVVYFVLWIAATRRLVSLSRRQDVADDPRTAASLRRLAAPSLVLYALTVTFAAFDWGMSLEPHWFSTVYGVLYATGAAFGALALAIVVLSRIADREPHAAFLRPETVGDLGNLALTLTMFWAYIAVSQFIIIWSGNLPEETPWYWTRMHNGWGVLGVALFVLQFGLPFLLLLSRATKRNIRKLAAVAVFILIMRFVDILWLVAPAFDPELLRVTALDLAALAGIGGIWVAWYLRLLRAAPLLPVALVRAEALAEDGHHA
jgi:hypothetical protein